MGLKLQVQQFHQAETGNRGRCISCIMDNANRKTIETWIQAVEDELKQISEWLEAACEDDSTLDDTISLDKHPKLQSIIPESVNGKCLSVNKEKLWKIKMNSKN